MEKKYIPLSSFFSNSISTEIKLSFADIESIMGQELPNAAYLNVSWWKKEKPPSTHFEAWIKAGYHIKSVIIGTEVTFSRTDSNEIVSTENNEIYIVREIELVDARPLINLREAICSESKFELYRSEEIDFTVQGVRKKINLHRKTNGGVTFLSIINGKIAGYITLTRYKAPRNLHIASIRFGVLQQWQEKGIAETLLNSGQKWATEQNITRLEAIIVESNEDVKQTLISHGFDVEGIRKNAYYNENGYLHEQSMYKLL